MTRVRVFLAEVELALKTPYALACLVLPHQKRERRNHSETSSIAGLCT